MSLPCYLCPGFPVGSCQSIPSGATCEANTVTDSCVGDGTLRFRCPSSANNGVAYSQRLSIGPHWGAGSYFELRLRSGDLGYDGNGFRKRSAELVSASGSFDVKCRVCGVGTLNPQDTDSTVGVISARLEFGPNVLNGVVDEGVIQGYRVYLATDCSVKLTNSLAYVSKSNVVDGASVNGMCGCPASKYSVQVRAQLPAGVDEGRLMIVPVTTGGYELPMGTMTALVQDNKGVAPTFTRRQGDTVKVTGNVDVRIGCQYAATYVTRPEVKRGWLQAISDHTGVVQQYISVSLRNRCSARRLALDSLLELAGGRSLQSSSGQVTVSYDITLPASIQSQATDVQQSMSRPNAAHQLSQLSSRYVDHQMAGTGVAYNTVVVGVSSTQTAVQSPQDSSGNKGLIAGIVIGSVSGAWLIACLLFCLCCNRRSKKKQEAELIGTV